MFNLDTVPEVIIKTINYNNIDIVRDSVRPETYVLFNKGLQWMNFDKYTNKELKEQYSHYDMAYGDVLISGFGFGLAACWLASKPEVKSVTVLEISQDVYDIFLLNNKLPNNVSVIITDASEYKTDKHFDCVFLDHYEKENFDWVVRNMRKIVSNIPNHDLFWFWPFEQRYATVAYGIERFNTSTTLWDTYIDFYKEYDHFKKNVLQIPTLPNLSKDKINEYVYTFSDRLGYSIPS
jgi:hypothetical protein